jgi:hypothetical protein
MLIGVAVLLALAQAETAKQADALHRTVVTVHLDRPIGKISPYIYGTNDDRPQAWTESKRHTFGRIGGNRWTAYNWENNASNAGKDWHHQNDGYLCEINEPARAVTDRLDVIQRHGAPALVTVPIQGWAAADKNGDGDVAKAGEDFRQKRFLANIDVSWKKRSLQPDRADRVVFQNEFVAFLERWRVQRRGPPIWYSLDNEPDLWHETHPRIQGNPIRPRDLIQRSIQFAKVIKQESPEALVFGPAVSGWKGLTTGGSGAFDRDHYFIEDYVAAFEQERKKTGKRLLDVLDVHWYPEHRSDTDVRVMEDDGSEAVAAARATAPRSLDEQGFVERSWITRSVLHASIMLLPRLMRIIRENDPDLKLAITEYYFGGGDHPSGAVAQADVLGISGREGVFAANLFHVGKSEDKYILAAFDLYRNYDGEGGAFGDDAVMAHSDRDHLGVHAAVHSTPPAPRAVTVVLLNRSNGWSRVNIRFVGKAPDLVNTKRYQVAAPVAKPVKIDAVDLENLILPPMSATLIVAR